MNTGCHFVALLTKAFLWMIVVGLTACDSDNRQEVVVYTALDSVFSRKIFEDFEAKTGIRVLAVYDTEATKTTGLVERLRREKARPQCDVFWNNEILRTIRLANDGHFTPYKSPNAVDIPDQFKAADGSWTGFAARARVIAYDPNRTLGRLLPKNMQDLLQPSWKGQLSIANPQFGTTGTHMACLLDSWGEPRFVAFLQDLKKNEVRIVAGNSTSRDRVLSGEVLLGFTDTDDVHVVRKRGESIAEIMLEDEGMLLIPNTVALIKGSANLSAAKKFIDFVLSKEVEAQLAAAKSRQIPLRVAVPVPEDGLHLEQLRVSNVDYARAASLLPKAVSMARQILSE